MYVKSVCNLIYVGKTKLENGSPKDIEFVKQDVKCDESETFSNQYYTEQKRSMRLSRNLIIPTELTKDLNIDDVRYELTYVTYDGLRYQIQNILKLKKTRQRMILDLEEVR